ncbi:putative FBD-associated F-box protein At5g56560 [Brassica rapa]|uniref:FBD domain-containing protein n=2 Tax=Brassica TaxID=3705 RepID=A0ABQ8E853_BRANA|nr:putative FBD-associated F-box protein At5g56560 [Brassica napus]XP_033141751.1 putative FBD-associated F-box protein At5g56560 [Brassica rapa]KAH0937567.1 hypothetical protein HID58_005028 [Brassica napus]
MVKERLNELPDELIVTILSKLPTFKESVATRLISRRYEDPWNLAQDVTLKDNDEESFMTFLYGSLLSNDAPALERLRLKLTRKHSASDIEFWVQTAVNRNVRKLRFDLLPCGTLELPSCLRTCTTLKSLILRGVLMESVPSGFRLPSLRSLHLFSVNFSIGDSVANLLKICPHLEYLVLNDTRYDVDHVDDEFAPLRFCLSSLKSLHLCSVIFSGNNSVTRLLRSCPVLETLVINQTKCAYKMFEVVFPPRSCLSSLKTLHLLSVNFSSDESVVKLLENCKALENLVITRTRDDNVWLFNITVPTLKSLSISNAKVKRADAPGFVINAPSLERLNIKDTVSNFLMFGYMPEVTTANIEAVCDQSENFVGSLTFMQHLSLCSPTTKTPYTSGTVFFFLEHLELCTCSARWAKLLGSILNDAPRLQSIKLKSKCSARFKRPMELWTEPTVAPECLLKHLEILEWREYDGTEQERKVAAYILGNATCLKMATFSTRSGDKCTELKKISRVSEICQLVFE